jgi:hypothetical protein
MIFSYLTYMRVFKKKEIILHQNIEELRAVCPFKFGQLSSYYC